MGCYPEDPGDPLELRPFLETIGDCVVVVDDEEIIKVHVHRKTPATPLQGLGVRPALHRENWRT